MGQSIEKYFKKKKNNCRLELMIHNVNASAEVFDVEITQNGNSKNELRLDGALQPENSFPVVDDGQEHLVEMGMSNNKSTPS